jgi:hypothetical protein
MSPELASLAPPSAGTEPRLGSTNFPFPLLSVQLNSNSAPAPPNNPTNANTPTDLPADFETKRASGIKISLTKERPPADYASR